MGQLDDLAYKLVELSYKAMRSTPPTKTSDAVLAAALKKEKKQWAAVDNLEPYKKLYVAAGYYDYVGKSIKKKMSPAAAISDNTAKALDTTLPELFGLMAAANGITSELLEALLAEEGPGVALHGQLFEATLQAKGKLVTGNLFQKFEAWMQPRLAEARKKEAEARKKAAMLAAAASADVPESEAQRTSASDYGIAGGASIEEMLGDKPRRKASANDDKVYAVVDQPPTFPGGESALLAWVGRSIHYPEDALKKGTQGVVLLRFVVLENGSVGDVLITRGLSKSCDAEVVRVVKSLPRFISGKHQGKPVRVWYTLPIRFYIF